MLTYEIPRRTVQFEVVVSAFVSITGMNRAAADARGVSYQAPLDHSNWLAGNVVDEHPRAAGIHCDDGLQ